MPTSLRFQIRGDTAEEWATKNPKLLVREIGYDSTTRRLKVGDGSKLWNDLAFLPPDVIDDLTTGGSGNALSAEQGKVLKGLVDTNASKLSELEERINDVASNGVTVRDDFTHAEANTALSAGRGKVLYETKAEKSALTSAVTSLTTQINTKASTTQLTTLQTNLTNLITSSKVTVEDALTSTSTVNALSANQGRVLKGLVDSSKTELTNLITSSKNIRIFRYTAGGGDHIMDGFVSGAGAKTNNDKDVFCQITKVTIPSGVKHVLISGSGAGGGLSYMSNEFISGNSGAYIKNVLVKVNEGDVIKLQAGRGGAGLFTSTNAGYRGGDSVVTLNGTEIIRLAGGRAGIPAGTQSTETKLASHPQMVDSDKFHHLYYEAHYPDFASFKPSLFDTSPIREYIFALFPRPTGFSPAGCGGTLMFNKGVGASGVLILEYVKVDEEE